MSRNVELPDDVYSRIEAEASTTGSTVAQWIETVAPTPSADPHRPLPEHARVVPAANGTGQPPHANEDLLTISAEDEPQPDGVRTMADRLEGLIGTIDSGGLAAIAARSGDAFSDHLIEEGETDADVMSKSVELPEAVYTRVEEVASAAGSTVAEVIAARFPAPSRAPVANGGAEPPRTLADRFEGLLGVVSLDRTDLAERHSELFAEGMEEKHRLGHL